ncbi:hypothetical protein QZJ86_13865 [Methylomonas montana]|uniref:hypothetical protein n=1 Tax=Methylomonas montana TaxID=3058963 RepID=UPI0026593B13|nr:hypothetical protein [Methylomonas montana]WKJ89105.1 hypothetical protein QZJ86_13865 [Methylomonas montana]
MGFLNNLFGGKKSISSVLVNTQKKLFRIYNISNPSDAQKMKASVYLCITGIASFNELGNNKPELRPHLLPLIDNLVQEAKELTKSLSIRVKDITNDNEELKGMLDFFPRHIPINESTNLNGLAAFEALYNSKVTNLIDEILNHTRGPFGSTGYAAIIVADGIFGKGASEDYFIDVAKELEKFTLELCEAR